MDVSAFNWNTEAFVPHRLEVEQIAPPVKPDRGVVPGMSRMKYGVENGAEVVKISSEKGEFPVPPCPNGALKVKVPWLSVTMRSLAVTTPVVSLKVTDPLSVPPSVRVPVAAKVAIVSACATAGTAHMTARERMDR